MSGTQVRAIQNDTMDSIAYRYFGNDAVAMLPALMDANPDIQALVLAEHQLVNLPAMTQTSASQTLKLWD